MDCSACRRFVGVRWWVPHPLAVFVHRRAKNKPSLTHGKTSVCLLSHNRQVDAFVVYVREAVETVEAAERDAVSSLLPTQGGVGRGSSTLPVVVVAALLVVLLLIYLHVRTRGWKRHSGIKIKK